MTTKSNNMMAFTSVEDLTGTMEVIVFPKVLDAFRDVLKETPSLSLRGGCPSARMRLQTDGRDDLAH